MGLKLEDEMDDTKAVSALGNHTHPFLELEG